MKRFTANWGLKLASLIFAIIIWFLVTNINDPITSVRYTNIPVTIKNGNLITDNGQVYTVLDGSDTISSVTIYASRSVIDSLSQSNVVATADIQDLSSLNTVSINVTTNKYSDKIDDIVLSSDVVKLNVERKASKSMVLTATTSGTVTDGYIVGDVTTEQNMVRLSGPESFINQISKAAVDVDVTGFTSNIGTDADVVLYDADGNVLDASSNGVTMNIKTVRVNVQILQTKYVPITYTVTGEPATGFELTGEIESTPDTVLLAGRSSVISGITELNVSDEALDVSGLTSTLTCTVDLTDSLPSGVVFGDSDFNGTASVVVYIGGILDKTLDVSLGNISISGALEGYTVTIDESEYETVSLTVQGLAQYVDGLEASDISGVVDVSLIQEENNLEELKTGTYSAEVEFYLPTGVTIKNPVSVYVNVEANE